MYHTRTCSYISVIETVHYINLNIPLVTGQFVGWDYLCPAISNKIVFCIHVTYIKEIHCRKHVLCFYQVKNTSQHGSVCTAFLSLPKLSLVSLKLSKDMEKIFSFSFSFRKQLVYLDHQYVNSLSTCHHQILTACASSSYRNMILSQSAYIIFSWLFLTQAAQMLNTINMWH